MEQWSIAGAMEFKHLPLAGGLYDQHPKLLSDWAIIWKAQSDHENHRQKEQEAKVQQQQKGGATTSRVKGTPSAI